MFAENLTDADPLKLYLTLKDLVNVPGHVYALSCTRVKIEGGVRVCGIAVLGFFGAVLR